MKKRIFSALALSLVMVIGLTACNSADKTSSTTTSAPTSAEQTSAQPTSEAKLVYWSMWNEAEPQGQTIKAAIEAYTAKTGVKVDINWNGRDIRKTLQPALDANTTIDIFDEELERVTGTWGNYLLDVESMATKTYDTTNGKAFSDSINKTLFDLARTVSPGGKLSAIPYQPTTFVVMYNKKLFKDAGITDVPKTWAEFTDVCKKLKEKNVTGITVDDAYMAALIGYSLGRTIGKEATEAIAASGKFDDPGVLEVAQKWEEMVKNGYISKLAATNVFPAGQQEIADGSVAMYLNGTWLPNEIKDATGPDFEWGSFAFPKMSDKGDGPEANYYGAQCFAINKKTAYPQEAFDLIVWLTTGEWDAKLAENSLGVPVGNDSTWPPQLADAKVIFDSTTVRYQWAVGMENTPEMNAKIKANFAKLISGSLDAQGFADEMKK